MCGILTFCSFKERYNALTNHKKFFTQALIADTFRGKDSTGIIAVPHKLEEDVQVFKKALTGYDFVESNQYDRFITDFADYKFIVGHNRASTRGASTATNAHPFQHGDITLVHNGTLTYHNSLIKGKETFTVDSEAVCFAFNERTPEEVIPEISGAFAFIWHDGKDDSINFIRNNERPFAIAKLKDEDAIIGASEVKMLEWLADRNNIKIEKPVELTPGVLLSFTDTFDKPNKITKIALKPKPAATSQWSYYKTRSSDYNYNNNSKNMTETARRSFATKLGLSEKDILDFTIDRVVQQPVNKGKANLFGTYYSRTGLGYPVRQYGVEWETIKGLKKGDKMAGYVANFIKNVDKTHHSISSHYISVTESAKTDDFVNELIKEMDSPSNNDNKNLQVRTTHKNTMVVGKDPDKNKLVGPNGNKIGFTKFKKMTENGCVICTGNVHPSDHKKLLWTPDKQPICKDCAITDYGRSHSDSHYVIM